MCLPNMYLPNETNLPKTQYDIIPSVKFSIKQENVDFYPKFIIIQLNNIPRLKKLNKESKHWTF